jgi:hypothetical protein
MVKVRSVTGRQSFHNRDPLAKAVCGFANPNDAVDGVYSNHRTIDALFEVCNDPIGGKMRPRMKAFPCRPGIARPGL